MASVSIAARESLRVSSTSRLIRKPRSAAVRNAQASPTRAEIEEIRGVSVSAGTLDQLMEMGWVKLGRRRMTPGRPMTFVVTQGFLDHFGLGSERDLPGIAELRAAGLLDNRPNPEAEPSDAAPEGQGELLD